MWCEAVKPAAPTGVSASRGKTLARVDVSWAMSWAGLSVTLWAVVGGGELMISNCQSAGQSGVLTWQADTAAIAIRQRVGLTL